MAAPNTRPRTRGPEHAAPLPRLPLILRFGARDAHDRKRCRRACLHLHFCVSQAERVPHVAQAQQVALHLVELGTPHAQVVTFGASDSNHVNQQVLILC
jgi:hypothetical protein